MTRIITVPFLIPFWAHAQVLLPGIIFVRRDVHLSVRLLAHELCHVRQIRRYTLIGYWVRYLWQLARFGYWDAPMEVEARAAELDEFYLQTARDLLWE